MAQGSSGSQRQIRQKSPPFLKSTLQVHMHAFLAFILSHAICHELINNSFPKAIFFLLYARLMFIYTIFFSFFLFWMIILWLRVCHFYIKWKTMSSITERSVITWPWIPVRKEKEKFVIRSWPAEGDDRCPAPHSPDDLGLTVNCVHPPFGPLEKSTNCP